MIHRSDRMHLPVLPVNSGDGPPSSHSPTICNVTPHRRTSAKPSKRVDPFCNCDQAGNALVRRRRTLLHAIWLSQVCRILVPTDGARFLSLPSERQRLRPRHARPGNASRRPQSLLLYIQQSHRYKAEKAISPRFVACLIVADFCVLRCAPASVKQLPHSDAHCFILLSPPTSLPHTHSTHKHSITAPHCITLLCLLCFAVPLFLT